MERSRPQCGSHFNINLRFSFSRGVEVLQKSADIAAPVLNNLGHYADWLEKHPFQYIVPTERLH